jgi:hypothetical protein
MELVKCILSAYELDSDIKGEINNYTEEQIFCFAPG